MTIKHEYDREDLIAAVVREINNIIFSYSDDPEIEEVDIRQQLVDGTYYVYPGDIQYITDLRGSWDTVLFLHQIVT